MWSSNRFVQGFRSDGRVPMFLTLAALRHWPLRSTPLRTGIGFVNVRLGKAENDPLQRVYGISFPDPKQLKVQETNFRRNGFNSRKRPRSATTDLLASNKSCSSSTSSVLAAASGSLTERGSTTSSKNSFALNIESVASRKSSRRTW